MNLLPQGSKVGANHYDERLGHFFSRFFRRVLMKHPSCPEHAPLRMHGLGD
jgi:hypothetical protein